MATKISILSTINGFITAIVTVAKTRSAFSTLLDNIYPTTQNETHTTDVITTSNANFEYTLNFTKVGRLVHVTGSVANVSGGILGSGYNVFEFKAGEFLPNTAILQVVNTNGIDFVITLGNEFQAITSIGVGKVIYFNFNYSTQD